MNGMSVEIVASSWIEALGGLSRSIGAQDAAGLLGRGGLRGNEKGNRNSGRENGPDGWRHLPEILKSGVGWRHCGATPCERPVELATRAAVPGNQRSR